MNYNNQKNLNCFIDDLKFNLLNEEVNKDLLRNCSNADKSLKPHLEYSLHNDNYTNDCFGDINLSSQNLEMSSFFKESLYSKEGDCLNSLIYDDNYNVSQEFNNYFNICD